jgi:hypothetical protein
MRRRLFVLALAFVSCLVWQRPAVADAPTTTPCDTINVSQPNGNVQPLAQLYCYPGPVTGYHQGDPIENYYGAVVVTMIDSRTTIAAKKTGIAQFFIQIFNKKSFSAQVSVTPEIVTANADIIMPERPLFIIKQADNSTTSEADSRPLNATQVTPYFALSSVASSVTMKFKVTVSNQSDIDISSVFSSASAAGSSLGGTGWVLSTAGQAAISKAAAGVQTALSHFNSSATTYSVSAPLDFNGGATAMSQATFRLTVMNGKVVAGNYDVTVALKARPSLITAVTRTNADGWFVPALNDPALAPQPGTWGDNIFIAPGSQLTAALRTDGVPQKLTAFQAPVGAAAAPLSTSVDAACVDLTNALRGGKYYWLDKTDADLILYDQLNANQVFRKVDHANDPLDDHSSKCIAQMEVIWTRAYGLAVPAYVAPGAPIPASADDMKKRLSKLSGGWKLPDAAAREVALEDNLTNPVKVLAVRGHFPEVDSIVDATGAEDAVAINPMKLSPQRLMCLGTYQKIDGNTMSALALFNGDNSSYIVIFKFDNSTAWSAREGPPVNSINVNIASATDLGKAAPGHCG